MINHRYFFVTRLLFLALIFSGPATGSATSLFDLLTTAGDRALPATLSTEHAELISMSAREAAATFRFTDQTGREHAFALQISERGRFRRKVCDHAPLKLNFKKGDLRAAGLADHDKYKLVLPCFSGPNAERLVRKEYLAYQAYRLFSPSGFRVRLLDLTYDDPDKTGKTITSIAFLIESKSELADRLMAGLTTMPFGQVATAYDPAAEVNQALFQYLIGNTDWDAGLSRNVKTFRTADGRLIPVGYDFDFSAWVSAPYARPRRELMQRSVQQRIYLGYAQAETVFAEMIDHYTNRRNDLEELILNADLPRYEQRRLGRLISNFYEELTLNNPAFSSLFTTSFAPAAAP